jgi:hypothetical protein
MNVGRVEKTEHGITDLRRCQIERGNDVERTRSPGRERLRAQGIAGAPHCSKSLTRPIVFDDRTNIGLSRRQRIQLLKHKRLSGRKMLNKGKKWLIGRG